MQIGSEKKRILLQLVWNIWQCNLCRHRYMKLDEMFEGAHKKHYYYYYYYYYCYY